MLGESSPEEFMKTGNLVWKVGSKSGIKEKFIWASNNEIRWSSPTQSSQQSSKIDADSILSVWTQEKFGNHFLVIETKHKTYKLQFKSPQIREKWHIGIQALISNTQRVSSVLGSNKLILGERNKVKKEENSEQQILNELISLVKQFSIRKAGDQAEPKDLPNELESILKEVNTKNYEKVEWLNSEENDPKRLASKISMMRKRLKMMEIEKEASSQINNLTFLLEKELKQNSFLTGKIEEALIEKSKISVQWGLLKAELDKMQDLQVSFDFGSEVVTALTPTITMHRVLQKGFICYICTLASVEFVEPLNLTPRRGYEEGVFKKRQVKVANDLKGLVWKPVGLFCKKTFTLPLNDICTVIEGTEDSSRFEPYENCRYLTIVSKGLTTIICIENYYGLYLDGIRDLYLGNIGVGNGIQDLSSVQIAKIASEQLQNQLLTYTRMFKRYKAGLVDSICSINFGSAELQEFLTGELQGLKNLGENMPLGIMAADSESYLRTERKVLIERLQAMKNFK